MASLSTNLKLGNVSAPSLIKSAATLQNQINAFNDAEAKDTYALSAKTADDLQTYTNYLNSRITTLRASNSPTDATKALSMQMEIISATHSNISADIARENIALMSAGDAGTVSGYQQKLNVIQNEYLRALGVGDSALAQSLMSQAYSVSQTMQNAQTTAATASATLSKAGITAQNGVADTLEKNLEKLNADVGIGGMAKLNANIKTYLNTKDPTTGLTPVQQLEAVGVKLSNGAQPSYQDIVMGVTQAEINIHTLAANAMAPYDPSSAQSYYNQGQAIANGNTTVHTLAGSLTAQQIQNWTQNPQMFAPKEEIVDGRLQFTYSSPSAQSGVSGVAGYKYQNGQVVANYTGSDISQNYTSKQLTQMNTDFQKLGLSFTKEGATASVSTANGVAVQTNNQTANFIKKLIPGQTGVGTRVYLQSNGNYQIATIDSSGNSHIYEITKDAKGLYGAYQVGTSGQYTPVGGQYGFNSNSNNTVGIKPTNKNANAPAQGLPVDKNATNFNVNDLVNIKSFSKNGIGETIGTDRYNSVKGNLGNNGLLAQLINQAQVQMVNTQQQQAQQSLKIAPPIPIPPVTPATPATAPVLKPFVAPQITANPQQTAPASTLQNATSPQFNVGGGNINQSGTKGIPISTPAVHGIPL